MAKLSIRAREQKRIKLVKQFKTKRDELRIRSTDLSLSYEDRIVAREAMQKLPKNSSPSRLRTRCRLPNCGRPRAVYRKFGLCRSHLRELLMMGEVPGATKSSW